MNTQEIKLFIENINKSKSIDNGFIGFYYDEEDHEGYSSYIKANRDGLILYATEILQASMEIENIKPNEGKVFTLSNDLTLNYSDFHISHIEFCDKSRRELEKTKEKHIETWKDKLGIYLFGGILIFILISILVGAITIFSWLF